MEDYIDHFRYTILEPLKVNGGFVLEFLKEVYSRIDESVKEEIVHIKPLLYVALLTACLTWLLTLATDNYSHMDRLWPIMPCVYSAMLLFNDESPTINKRLLLMTGLLFCWGIRLFLYFLMKGVYDCVGYDDYRWVKIKSSMSKLKFHIFNFYFIALFQNILLVLMVLPVYFVKLNCFYEELVIWDYIVTGLVLCAILLEAIADRQQFLFQKKKKENPKLDFISTGLFRYSRHPNYLGEMLTYAFLYLFTLQELSVSNTINYSIIGPLLYILIFQKSISVTEEMALRKYKRYKHYKKVTGKILPKCGFI